MNDRIVELDPILILEKESSFFVCLSELSGNREIYIEIGDAEATNLFLNMNNDLFPSKRPDSHDLMIRSLEAYGIRITGGLIMDREDDLWLGQLELINPNTKESISVDARPSDILIICIKLGFPVLIYEEVLDKKIHESPNVVVDAKDFSIIRLEELLKAAVEEENYEDAAKFRNLIAEKKKKKGLK